MPKIRTHKGAKARLHITGSGKIMRVKIGKSHFRRRKPQRVKGMFDEMILLDHTHRKHIRRMLAI